MVRLIHPESLPILTETADGTPIDLPVLRETVEDQLVNSAQALSLSSEQCYKLAEQLLPKIEATLLDAVSSSPDADWQTVMQKVRSHLPSLISQAVEKLR